MLLDFLIQQILDISEKKKMKSFFGNKVDDNTFQIIFDEIDSDKDGQIDFNDFKEMMMY